MTAEEVGGAAQLCGNPLQLLPAFPLFSSAPLTYFSTFISWEEGFNSFRLGIELKSQLWWQVSLPPDWWTFAGLLFWGWGPGSVPPELNSVRKDW